MNRTRTRCSVATALLVAMAACSSSAPAPTDLPGRLAGMGEPDTFTMTYRAAGTDVLDCVQPNRRFTIDVDTPASTFIVGQVSTGSILAERRGRILRLHRTLLADGTTDAAWVEVDLDVATDAQLAALRRVLGPDLAGYALGVGVPSSGLATASALVPVASSIDVAGEAAGATTFRLRLDAGEFAEGTGLDTDGDLPVPPLVDITVDDDRVRQVVVRPPGDEAAGGWTIDFTQPAADVPDQPAPGSSIDLDDLVAGDLRAPSLEGCAIGDETPTGAP